jgi:hypothetical protein
MNNTITSYPRPAHEQEENDDEIYDELQLIDSEYDDDCHSILSSPLSGRRVSQMNTTAIALATTKTMAFLR